MSTIALLGPGTGASIPVSAWNRIASLANAEDGSLAATLLSVLEDLSREDHLAHLVIRTSRGTSHVHYPRHFGRRGVVLGSYPGLPRASGVTGALVTERALPVLVAYDASLQRRVEEKLYRDL